MLGYFRQEGFDGQPVWFKLRRFRSVRNERGIFVWTDLGGSERQSATDPRIAWDREDRNFGD